MSIFQTNDYRPGFFFCSCSRLYFMYCAENNFSLRLCISIIKRGCARPSVHPFVCLFVSLSECLTLVQSCIFDHYRHGCSILQNKNCIDNNMNHIDNNIYNFFLKLKKKRFSFSDFKMVFFFGLVLFCFVVLFCVLFSFVFVINAKKHINVKRYVVMSNL